MTQQKESLTALHSLTSNFSSTSNQDAAQARAFKLQERIRKRQEASSVKEHIFVQRVDPLTGNVEWVVVKESIHTAHQSDQTESLEEVSASKGSERSAGENVEDWNDFVVKSSYLDMLNDEARNQAYAASIKKEVQPGDLVLDIGTGTGLLSMLAAQSLKEKAPPITSPNLDLNPIPNQEEIVSPQVITCESFPVMAHLAEKVIQENGLAEEIKVINKRSDELTVGPEQDLPRRADFLVSEILDSELLGEGLLPTLRDAWARLLRPGARTVPARARVFAQLVECEYLQQCHNLAGREASLTDGVRLASDGFEGLEKESFGKDLKENSCNEEARVAEAVAKSSQGCVGKGPPAWALHADAFGPHLKQLSEPFPVVSFDFAAPPESDRRVSLEVSSCADGTAHGLITWWEIDLDAECSITYTTAPEYALKNADAQHANADVHSYRGWHNHWRQCAWPFPNGGFRVLEGSAVPIEASHDELGLWYRASPEDLSSEEPFKGSGVLKKDESISTEAAAKSGSQDQTEQNRAAEIPKEEILAEEYVEVQQQQCEPLIFEHVAADKWSCTCGMHEKQSPERVGLLGDPVWRSKMSRAVRLALRLDAQASEASSENISYDHRETESEASDETRSNHVGFQKQIDLRRRSDGKEEHLNSELGCRLGAKTEGLYGSLGEQGSIIVVADDSPLLPLLAARQLSENFGQARDKPALETSRLPSTQDSELVAQAAFNRQVDGRTPPDDSPSKAAVSSSENGSPKIEPRPSFAETVESRDFVEAGLPIQTRKAESCETMFAAKNGPASVDGFMHRRAAASGVLQSFVPQRFQSMEDLKGKKIAALLAEPWYATCDSGPPWAHALRFWHQRTSMGPFLLPGAAIMPYRAVIRGVAIHSKELWESRRALSRVQGFDHSATNQLLGACGLADEKEVKSTTQKSNSKKADTGFKRGADKACSEGASQKEKASTEKAWKEEASRSDKESNGHKGELVASQKEKHSTGKALGKEASKSDEDLAKGCPVLSFPLWQCGASYKEVSEPFDLLTFDFSREMASLEGTAEVLLDEGLLSCHGLALWMEYQLSGDERLEVSTRWSPGDGPSFHQQGVLLFQTPIHSSNKCEATRSLQARTTFDSKVGNVLIHVTTNN